jgi:Cof subfamily protein (haloacid dehalogenase superfamily)
MNLPRFDTAPQAIAIDLDGTLLDSKSQLSSRSRAAVEGCLLNGLPVIIATSRPERSVRRLIGDDLTNKCSLVMMNGAIARGVAPLSGSIRETIPQEAARDIVEMVLRMEPAVRVTIEIEGFEFGWNARFDPDILWQINSATPDMVLPLEAAIARVPAKIAVNGVGRDLSAIASDISGRFGHLVSVVPTGDMKFLNITSIKASKPDALQHLLDPQQISLADALAFGDDTPDIEMLRACGISVAVGNAVAECLAAAKYCTASNDDDGVAVVLESVLEAMPL